MLETGWRQGVDLMPYSPPLGRGLPSDGDVREPDELTRAISGAILALYFTVYGHGHTTARTYINDNVVVCVLESILTDHERDRVVGGLRCEVIDARVAFQSDSEDEFSAAIKRLTPRNVVAFLSANQTWPGVACELFVLDGSPLARVCSA